MRGKKEMRRIVVFQHGWFMCSILLISFSSAVAQNASVQWDLLADSAATKIVGNCTGQVEQLSASATDSARCLTIKDYAANSGGQRLNLGRKTWPNQTAIDTGRYVQFSISPTSGYSLQVTAIALTLGAGGTSSMRAAIYYAVDSMFAGSTVLAAKLTLPNSGWVDSTLTTYALSKTINELETFYVRIYPWYESTNASTSKYLYLRNVQISGTTFSMVITNTPLVMTAALSSITHSSAVCGGTVVSAGNAPVTARGVCWKETGMPTISDNKTVDGAGIGSFTSTISGLTNGGAYVVRAYATNTYGTSYGTEYSFVAADPSPRLPAFPGAEGFGKFVVGGRGGRVIEVTSLEDTTIPGTLRYAVNQSGARTVVFRVSGTITLKSNLNISNPYITIAGQTAPGDGICLRKYELVVATNQVIVRYIRCRLGDESGGESDAFGGRGVTNVIMDHCSASWSEDETLSFYWCDSTTVQWCISSESLYNSNHVKGAHGYGGIWGGPRASFHHNLLAHHSSRNPRFGSGVGITDYRNNVVYNWGFNSSYGAEDTSAGSPVAYSTLNMVNNYYKAGPATSSGQLKYRIMNPSTHNSNTADVASYGKFYVAGNKVAGYDALSADNWSGGIQPQGGSSLCSALKSDTAFPCMNINMQSADSAFTSVLAGAGATRPKRDAVDTRIVADVTGGTATYAGVTYPASHSVLTPCGIIDSQSDVGGWPELASTPAPGDSDHDGMPDSWEISHGLNPNDAADRNAISSSGYTSLEVYLNGPELLGTTGVAASGSTPEGFSLSQNYPNPFNPTTTIRFSVPKKSRVRLEIYSVLGQHVATLKDGTLTAGDYQVEWNAGRYASGLYLVRMTAHPDLEAGGRIMTLSKKIMLVK